MPRPLNTNTCVRWWRRSFKCHRLAGFRIWQSVLKEHCRTLRFTVYLIIKRFPPVLVLFIVSQLSIKSLAEESEISTAQPVLKNSIRIRHFTQFSTVKGELRSILILSSFFCKFGVLSVQRTTTKIGGAYTYTLFKICTLLTSMGQVLNLLLAS